MKPMKPGRVAAAATVLVLLVPACSSDSDVDFDEEPTTTSQAEEAPTTTAARATTTTDASTTTTAAPTTSTVPDVAVAGPVRAVVVGGTAQITDGEIGPFLLEVELAGGGETVVVEAPGLAEVGSVIEVERTAGGDWVYVRFVE
jgi:hypothetical protein